MPNPTVTQSLAPATGASPLTTFGRDEYFDDIGRFPVDVGQGPNGQGRYQSLYDSNPYRNLTYKQSGWQKMLSGLGFRTAYDDFVEQAQINAAEYDAGIASMQFQNEYNSPAAEANRMRAAGLNPDLQGIQDVAESAGPTEDPNGMPAQDSRQEAAVLTSFAKGIYSCVMGGLSFAKDVTAMKQMDSVIEGQNIANAKSMMSAIDEMIFGSIPAEDVDSHDGVRFAAAINGLADNIPDFRSMGFSDRQIETGQQMWRSRIYSLGNDERLRTAAYNRYKAMSESNKVRSSGFYSEGEMEDEVIGIMIDSLAATARDWYQQKQKNDLTQENVREGQIVNEGIESNIKEQYLDTLNEADYGAIEGNAAIEEQRARRSRNALDNVISENKEILYKALRDAADRGNSRAQAVLYLMVVNDLASFEVSGGVDLNFLKGVSAIAKSVLSFGPKGNSSTDESGSNLLKNLGLGADVKIKVGNK